ncbi:non-ribosomal peptide synthetase [Streptomyces chartreusis]|uniref:non-ribosomal peptide synthetase n=1 Tax=Streptomyces chartreusis TaxID=1969 RepID=UPI002F9140EC|nr:non-ribosomal peptide synthetase [Streptomyces chartreusis]
MLVSHIPAPATPKPPAPGQTVLEWFSHWAEIRPHAFAVLTSDAQWDYATINSLSSDLAARLREHLGPGDVVGVLLPRSVTLVVTALALAKAGVSYLPLGETPPTHRRESIVTATSARHLIASADHPDLSGHRVVQHSVADVNLALIETGRPAGSVEKTPAPYAIATSGSTGRPKVVLGTHESLASLISWLASRLAIKHKDHVAMAASPSFDAHLIDLWLALGTGATLVVPPEGVLSSAEGILDWCANQRVNSMFLPTPLGELVMGAAWPAHLVLRSLLVGGDRLRVTPAPDCPAEVFNVYGPTEAGVVTTTHLVAAHEDPLAIPIGTPLSGREVTVTDETGTVLPRGMLGELRISGAGLAAGYAGGVLGGFVPAAAGKAQMYRTGDRVLMRHDGVLEFHGRLDDQFKIDGVRLELAEIEAALLSFPGVVSASACLLTTSGGHRQVGAAIATSAGASCSESDLLAHTAAHLPGPAVPRTVLFLDDLPTNDNGKVDRATLAKLLDNRPDTNEEDRSAATVLLAMVRDLVGQDLGLTDSLADAGVNSITTARLISRIRDEFDVPVRAIDVIRAETVADILAALQRSEAIFTSR